MVKPLAPHLKLLQQQQGGRNSKVEESAMWGVQPICDMLLNWNRVPASLLLLFAYLQVEPLIQMMTASVVWKLDSRPAVAEAAAAALLTSITASSYSHKHSHQQQQEQEQEQQGQQQQGQQHTRYHHSRHQHQQQQQQQQQGRREQRGRQRQPHQNQQQYPSKQQQQDLTHITGTNAFRLLLSLQQCCYSPPVKVRQWLLHQIGRQFLMLDAFQVKQLQHLGDTQEELWGVVEGGVKGALKGRSVGELMKEHVNSGNSSSSSGGGNGGLEAGSRASSSSRSRDLDAFGSDNGSSNSRQRRSGSSSSSRGSYSRFDDHSSSSSGSGEAGGGIIGGSMQVSTASVLSASELLLLVKHAVLLGGRSQQSQAGTNPNEDAVLNPSATAAAAGGGLDSDLPLSWSGLSRRVAVSSSGGYGGSKPPSSSSSAAAAAAATITGADTTGAAAAGQGAATGSTCSGNRKQHSSNSSSSPSNGVRGMLDLKQQEHRLCNRCCPASVALLSDLLATVGQHPKWLKQHCSMLDLMELLWSAALLGLGGIQQHQPRPHSAAAAAGFEHPRKVEGSGGSNGGISSSSSMGSSSHSSRIASQHDVAQGLEMIAHALARDFTQLKPLITNTRKTAQTSHQLKAMGLTPPKLAQLVRAVSMLQLRVPELLGQLEGLVRVQAFGLNPSSLATAAWVFGYQFKWPCMGLLQSISQALLKPVPEDVEGKWTLKKHQHQLQAAMEEGEAETGAEVGIMYSMEETLEGFDNDNGSSSSSSMRETGAKAGAVSKSMGSPTSPWYKSSTSSTTSSSSSSSSSSSRCGLQLLCAADVAGLAVALATAGWGSPQLLGQLADCAEGLVGEMDGQQLAQVSVKFHLAAFIKSFRGAEPMAM